MDWNKKLIRLDGSMELRTPVGDAKSSAFIEKKPGMLRTEANIAYGRGSDKEHIVFSSRMKALENKKGQRCDFDV